MARMRKYGESKITRIMMATVPHVISGLGLRKFQADGFLLTRVYIWLLKLEEQGEEEEACVGQKGYWLFLQRAPSCTFIVFVS